MIKIYINEKSVNIIKITNDLYVNIDIDIDDFYDYKKNGISISDMIFMILTIK